MPSKIITIKKEWIIDLVKLKQNYLHQIDIADIFDKIIRIFDKLVDMEFKINMAVYENNENNLKKKYPINLNVINKHTSETSFEEESLCYKIITRDLPIIEEIYECLDENKKNLNTMKDLEFPLHWFFLVHLAYNDIEFYRILREDLKNNKIIFDEKIINIKMDSGTIYCVSSKVTYKRKYYNESQNLVLKIKDLINYYINIYSSLIELSKDDDVYIYDSIIDTCGINKNVLYTIMCFAIRESSMKYDIDNYITLIILYNDDNSIISAHNYCKNNLHKRIEYVVEDINNFIENDKINRNTKGILSELHDINVNYIWLTQN